MPENRMPKNRMKTRPFLVLSLTVGLLLPAGLVGLSAYAARKYYPPGFTPSADSDVNTPSPAAAKPEPTVPLQLVPTQVIIKTVVKVPTPVRPKPRDPLAVLMEERRYYDALRLTDARLKQTPNSLTLQFTRGQLLRKEGQSAQAIEQFNAIVAKSRSRNTRATAWNGIGWTWYEKALQDKKVGNRSDFRGSIEAADNAFRQAVQLFPGFSDAWAGLGRTYLLAGRMKDAEAPIRKANHFSPNSLPAQLAQAEWLLARSKPQDALQVLYGLKKTTTAEPDVFFLLAYASLEAGRVDDSIINLKQLLEMEPEHTAALKLLSRAYALKMKPEDAEETLKTAIALDPADIRSAEALLKIYDDRGDAERGVLLLRNLLKSRPEQGVYVYALLARLNRAARWEESYEEGARLLPALLRISPEPEATRPVVLLFARAVYQKGRGMLDRRALLEDASVIAAGQYIRQHWELSPSSEKPGNERLLLQNRLALLYLNPLGELPPFPPNFQPDAPDLPIALEYAFLTGNAARHAALLEQAKKTDGRLDIARHLYEVGDYTGAELLTRAALAQNAALPGAPVLWEQLASARVEAQDHRLALSTLSKKTSDAYWQKIAGDTLRSGWGDYKTHALLAKILEKKQLSEVALFHAQLAARYAPTPKERDYWSHQVGKWQRATKF